MNLSADLHGKVILVTGAGAGIGRASCLLFAKNGATVVPIDVDDAAITVVAEQIRAFGGTTETITADVSSLAAVNAAVKRVMSVFHRIDVLFNNAGIVPTGKLHELTEAEWDRTFAINVKSMFLFCRAVVPIMQRQGGGCILNMSSATALRSVPDRAAYNASKSAVLALTRSMAVDYARDRIRVNCLCPGTTDTPSFRQRFGAAANADEALKSFVARQPLGRLGTAEEIAEAALYLISDAASFLTGTALAIDGGMSL